VLIGRNSLAVLDADREVATLDPLHIVAIKDLPRKKMASASGEPRGCENFADGPMIVVSATFASVSTVANAARP